MIGPIKAFKSCIKKSFVFNGRARRSEYWWFVILCAFLLSFTIYIDFRFTDVGLNPFGWFGLSGWLYLLLVVPFVSVSVRRLHDRNWSGQWILWFALVFGFIIFRLWEGLMIAISGSHQNSIPFFGHLVHYIFFFAGCALFICLLVNMVCDSQDGENKYGANPKSAG